MTQAPSSSGVQQELTAAIDDLKTALARANEATAAIRALVPQLTAAGSVLEEIEALVRSGRGQSGATDRGAFAALSVVAPGDAQLAPEREKQHPVPPPVAVEPPAEPVPALVQFPSNEPALTCFRLEFESAGAPLDLRTVDDAVSEHPAVRDVALLDYDGKRATLKVWITDEATPADVQSALSTRAADIFTRDQDVNIVALEEVA